MRKRHYSIIGIFIALAVFAYENQQSIFSTLLPASNTAASEAALPKSGSHSLIIEPDAGITPILNAIRSASSSVDLVMYELSDMDIDKVLAEDAARGVSVRVLLNGGYYSKKESNRNDSSYQYLKAHGVQVQWTPTYFALTHQKTFVIDGKTAYILTFNMVPKYYATGRDFGIADTDAADVSAIEAAFDSDWQNRKVPAASGDNLLWSPGSKDETVALIDDAKSTLEIYNEEMADNDVIDALAQASQRGVSVRIVMSYSTSWKLAFEKLTGAGASIRTFASSAPLYIHAKVIIADNAHAFVGSQNFSSNSLLRNRELGILINNPEVITQLGSTFESDWARAATFIP